jgi:hypothetical protein
MSMEKIFKIEVDTIEESAIIHMTPEITPQEGGKQRAVSVEGI